MRHFGKCRLGKDLRADVLQPGSDFLGGSFLVFHIHPPLLPLAGWPLLPPSSDHPIVDTCILDELSAQ